MKSTFKKKNGLYYPKFLLIESLGMILSEIFQIIDKYKATIEIDKMIYIRELALNDKAQIKKFEEQTINGYIRYATTINKYVKLYNDNYSKVLNHYYTKHKLSKLPVSLKKTHAVFNKYCRTDHTNSSVKIIGLGFDKFYDVFFYPLLRNISERNNSINSLVDSFGLENIPQEYKNKVIEVIDLFSLNYSLAGLLVLGKIFEEIITRYLMVLSTRNQIDIKTKSIVKMSFENKLNFLVSNKFIGYKDQLILSKLKFDRNIGGHFSKKAIENEAKHESEATIKLALGLITKYYNKISKNIKFK
jgi:hypothetical protein